jgi:hypothetical protein
MLLVRNLALCCMSLNIPKHYLPADYRFALALEGGDVLKPVTVLELSLPLGAGQQKLGNVMRGFLTTRAEY